MQTTASWIVGICSAYDTVVDKEQLRVEFRALRRKNIFMLRSLKDADFHGGCVEPCDFARVKGRRIGIPFRFA